MNVARAAETIALQWPCFPCNGLKRPVTAHGLKDASVELHEVRRMFRAPGAEMIGVPTGKASGFFVVDLDVKDGASGLEWLAAVNARLPRTRRHRTRSGGLHLMFAMPEGRSIRNSASKVAAGVDIRGEGGYVIVPPSPGYSVADDLPIAEAPAWLLDLIDPPKLAEPPRPAPSLARPILDGDGTPYGLAALRRECDAIRGAADGAKHDTLNRAAYSIGGLVAAGEILEGAARRALQDALGALLPRCEDPRHAEKTLATAFRDGIAAPRPNPPPRLVTRVTEHFAEPPDMPLPPLSAYDDAREAPDFDPETGEVLDPPPKVERTPGGPAKPVLPVRFFADAKPSLDAADFVEGLLIDGTMSVLYGESNSGKTFFVTDLAFHVAAGRPWRDRAVEQGGVLFLAMEGAHGITNRLAALKAEYGLEDANIPFAFVPVALNLLDPEADTRAVIQTIKAVAAQMGCPIKLVVVDTLARAIAGGNENSSEDMGALVVSGDRIREATGAHVLWIHHSGKDQAKGARGHSSLRAATDTEIEVTNDNGARTATVTKQRDLPSGDRFAFTLKVVELGKNQRGKAVTSCVVEAGDEQAPGGASARPRLKGHKQRALEVLADLIATSGQTGHAGVPSGLSSVPDKWWRERFYERAMPGAEQNTRKTAFLRASQDLVNERRVGMDRGRVWIV